MGSWSMELKPNDYKVWRQLLLRRMSREGLLGKRMGR